MFGPVHAPKCRRGKIHRESPISACVRLTKAGIEGLYALADYSKVWDRRVEENDGEETDADGSKTHNWDALLSSV